MSDKDMKALGRSLRDSARGDLSWSRGIASQVRADFGHVNGEALKRDLAIKSPTQPRSEGVELVRRFVALVAKSPTKAQPETTALLFDAGQYLKKANA